ncbi:rhamnose/proton symporter RhaT [Coraliomargarita sinensis]|uniref:Rhamnose/proton symporter RhaT n=1 Tax=Coraliomargarita sinensis TaxID=2174842 RepID=A0A317ZFV5_9BACT|nr:L-rhamnose/proton symporter RhaT [Coraliomargarita sinensis]PXA04406.1 rhamnose/proton symporter RhaT [Coraliomargarita sinensis]
MDSSTASPFLGVLLHAIGGLAAASFYLPFRKVRTWPWENAWLMGGLFSWLIAPAVAALFLAPRSWQVLSEAPLKSLFWTWFFGFLWGIGGLTFGLTMRYLGIALGYAVALGMCAAFGTLIPPIFDGSIVEIATSGSGQVILGGVAVCMAGIAMSGRAGLRKERELSDEKKQASVAEFHFGKGMLVALVAGVMSACMAFGFAAGKPIAALSVEAGIGPLWQNLPVLIAVLLGGFCFNLLWCGSLMIKRGSLSLYWGGQGRSEPEPLADAVPDASAAAAAEAGAVPETGSAAPGAPLFNYLWCAIAGVTWYLQFFFYGMGTTQMGAYEFSSWTLHMAAIIIFSTVWGILLREWAGTRKATHYWIAAGLLTLVLSTLIIGWGNLLGAQATGH